MDAIAAALDDDEPLPLLGVASALLSAFDEDPLVTSHNEQSLPPRDDVLQAFFDVDILETSALLAAVAGLSGDDVLRQRVRREIAGRRHVLPRWLVAMDQAEPVNRVFEMRHVLGDGDNIVVGVRLPGDHELCAAVYIDHNLGTLVKDAYVVPGALSDLVDLMRSTTDDPDTTLTDLDPADARARITGAIGLAAITFPPLETDTWPACRPLVEWVVGMLPAGGAGYERREWTDQERQQVADRVLASPSATGLADAGVDDADARGLLDSILWFGTDYGPGDPLRWSPVAVEILLADWIPRKIVADATYLTKAPDVLRTLVRFSHAERGIRPELTTETLDAVDEFEPEYQRVIRSRRPQGPAALLAAMGAFDQGEFDPAPLEQALDAQALDGLRQVVGGERALLALGTEPLPDEPFDCAGVPDDVRDRVAEVLALTDRGCDALLGDECRTAARRLLARVVAGDPGIFRGRGRSDTAAATICWLVAQVNDRFEDGTLASKELLGFFGVGANTPSQRSKAMLRALGAPPAEFGRVLLGSPDYLTSARRQQIVTARDQLGDALG